MRSLVIKPVALLSIITAATLTLFPLNNKSVNAQSDSQGSCVMSPQDFILPTTLVMMAYRGTFDQEGIPGYLNFKTGFYSGKISGDSIVKAAIAGCFLSDKYGMQDNSAYIADIQKQAKDFLDSLE